MRVRGTRGLFLFQNKFFRALPSSFGGAGMEVTEGDSEPKGAGPVSWHQLPKSPAVKGRGPF